MKDGDRLLEELCSILYKLKIDDGSTMAEVIFANWDKDMM